MRADTGQELRQGRQHPEQDDHIKSSARSRHSYARPHPHFAELNTIVVKQAIAAMRCHQFGRCRQAPQELAMSGKVAEASSGCSQYIPINRGCHASDQIPLLKEAAMLRKTIIILAATATVSAAGEAMARGGGGHGGGLGRMHSAFNPLLLQLIPKVNPQFNDPGPQVAPSSPGNFTGPRTSLFRLSPSVGWEPSGGHPEPNVREIPRKEDSSDAAMLKKDLQLDRKLETEVCRGC